MQWWCAWMQEGRVRHAHAQDLRWYHWGMLGAVGWLFHSLIIMVRVGYWLAKTSYICDHHSAIALQHGTGLVCLLLCKFIHSNYIFCLRVACNCLAFEAGGC